MRKQGLGVRLTLTPIQGVNISKVNIQVVNRGGVFLSQFWYAILNNLGRFFHNCDTGGSTIHWGLSGLLNIQQEKGKTSPVAFSKGQKRQVDYDTFFDENTPQPLHIGGGRWATPTYRGAVSAKPPANSHF